MLISIASTLLALCAVSSNIGGFPAQEGPTDEAATKAWEKLDPEVKEELSEWFRAEVGWLPTFQNKMIDFVLEKSVIDAGLLSVATDAPWYETKDHAPRQIIGRKALSATSSSVEKMRKEFFFRVPARKLDSPFVYDYTTGEILKTRALDDPDHIFQNALKGFPPKLALAEVIVEEWLDNGAEQEVAEAFAHAYTDRSGRVYTGLTLYDAWASGSNMEMPDVDCLGIIHDLKDDWKSYKAPVPESRQKKLYDEVGEQFKLINRHRGLRHAMAQCFLIGYPALRDGYGANLDRLHGLWDKHESTPTQLLDDLPNTKDWQKFIESWVKKFDKSKKLKAAGITRRDTLHNDGLWVRKKMIDIMLEAEVLKTK